MRMIDLVKALCIVPCGNRKIWDKHPYLGAQKARDVYVGSFAKKCQEYAETFYGDSYCILSAKYGSLLPDEIIPESYNVSFNKKITNPIKVEYLKKQRKEKNLDGYDEIVVLGGKNYAKMAKEVFSEKEIHLPLNDCKGIGYMMGKMNDAIKKMLIL